MQEVATITQKLHDLGADSDEAEGKDRAARVQLLGVLLSTLRHGASTSRVSQQLLNRFQPLLCSPREAGMDAVFQQLGVRGGGAEHTGQTAEAELHPANGTLGIGVQTGLQGRQADVCLPQPLHVGGVVAEGMAANALGEGQQHQGQLQLAEQIQLQLGVAAEGE